MEVIFHFSRHELASNFNTGCISEIHVSKTSLKFQKVIFPFCRVFCENVTSKCFVDQKSQFYNNKNTHWIMVLVFKSTLVCLILLSSYKCDIFSFISYPLSALCHDISPRAKGIIYEWGLIKGMIWKMACKEINNLCQNV